MLWSQAPEVSGRCEVELTPVLGLSIATELVGKGVRVAIVGRELPEDLDSAGFASPWAVGLAFRTPMTDVDFKGANWSAYAVNKSEQERERATFHHFDKLADSHPDLVTRTPFLYVASKDLYDQAWYKDLVRNVSGLALSLRDPTDEPV